RRTVPINRPTISLVHSWEVRSHPHALSGMASGTIPQIDRQGPFIYKHCREYRQAAGAAPQRLKRRIRRLSRQQVDRILELIPTGVAGPHITNTTLGQML